MQTAEIIELQPKRKRGRPKIDRTPTPCPHPFEDVAAHIQAIAPTDRPAAKQKAINLVSCDKRLAGTDLRVFIALVDEVFWENGRTERSSSDVAAAVAVPRKSAQRSIKRLADFGHIVRFTRRTARAWHSTTETAFPGLAELFDSTPQKPGGGGVKQIPGGGVKQIPGVESNLTPSTYVSSYEKKPLSAQARKAGEDSSIGGKEETRSTVTAEQRPKPQAARCDSGSAMGDVLAAPAPSHRFDFAEGHTFAITSSKTWKAYAAVYGPPTKDGQPAPVWLPDAVANEFLRRALCPN